MGNMKDLDSFFTWDKQGQRFVPSMLRRQILPVWLAMDQVTPYPVSVNAFPTRTSPFKFQQPYFVTMGSSDVGTPLEVRGLTFSLNSTDTTPPTDNSSNANMLVQMEEIGDTRLLMNQPVHIRTIFGTSQQPYKLRAEPFMFPSMHMVGVNLIGLSSLVDQVRMYMNGAQYYAWGSAIQGQDSPQKAQIIGALKMWFERRKFVTPFWITTDTSISLAANASGTFNAKVGDDGHFEAFDMTYVSTGDFLISISEVKSGRTIMNGQVTASNGLGTARFPFVFPIPYMVPAGQILRFDITDLSGSTNNIYITVGGRKIYAPFQNVQEVLTDTALPTSGQDVAAQSIAVMGD